MSGTPRAGTRSRSTETSPRRTACCATRRAVRRVRSRRSAGTSTAWPPRRRWSGPRPAPGPRRFPPRALGAAAEPLAPVRRVEVDQRAFRHDAERIPQLVQGEVALLVQIEEHRVADALGLIKV